MMNPIYSATVQKSPLAFLPEDRLITGRNESGIPYGMITLTPRERTVLEALGNCVVTTADLLLRALSRKDNGWNADSLNAALHRLCIWGTETGIRCENGTAASVQAYTVSDTGARFLKECCGEERGTRKLTASVTANPATLKRFLAAQRYALRVYPTADSSFGEIVCQEGHVQSEDRIFRVGALIHTSSGDILADGVRRAPMWESELSQKLDRIDRTLRSHPLNRELRSPSLVLVAEDPRHAEEICRFLSSVNKKVCCGVRIVNDCDTQVIPWQARTGILDRILSAVAV